MNLMRSGQGLKAVVCSCLAAAAVRAEEQVWSDGSPDRIWSTNAANWAGGAVWSNGNSAVFTGGGTVAGEAVDVSNDVIVAGMTFQTNGYLIADADANGTLKLAGGPSVITVVSAGDTGVVSEVIGGVGFTKAGAGQLQLAGANTFTGVVRVAEGTLRLSKYVPEVLGATGAGNDTVVEDGATLDINGAFTNGLNRAENLKLSGTGVNGQGALINTGVGCMNSGFSGTTTLLGDTVIGCQSRIDFRNTVVGNNHTLTKNGGAELAVGVDVNNCKIVINSGYYTYMNARALGTNDFDTTLNGGALRSYGDQTVTEHVFCNGGSIIASGSANNRFTIAGVVTLNSNIVVSTEGSNILDVPGLLEGPGGIRRSGGSSVYITCSTNTFTGPTSVDSGSTLYVGKTNLYSGVLSSLVVSNSGTLFGYSGRICTGDLVNAGALYCKTGLLSETGQVLNNGSVFLDRGGAFTVSNGFFGGGMTAIRYNGDVTVGGTFSSNGTWHVAHGALTLASGAEFCCFGEMTIANRDNVSYSPKLTNVVATVNVLDGCELRVRALTFGNGGDLAGGTMTGTLNQVGGLVRTTGMIAEDNGVRLGHYPQTRSFYNMMGGTLVVGADYDLGCATDGNGWFNMTGGEVFAKRVMLNERDNTGGFGRLTVSGGVMNLGSLSGSTMAVSNGIAADQFAPYLVELGGAGGVIRAQTNVDISVSATLLGAGANAITFDTQGWTVTMTNTISGAGGFNKTGAGTLSLSGKNTFGGAVRILEGAVSVASANTLPADAHILFGVSSEGAGGVLHAVGDYSPAGLTVGVANPEALDTGKRYTVITCDGELGGLVGGDVLPDPWYLYYDWANGRVELRAEIGTLIKVR